MFKVITSSMVFLSLVQVGTVARAASLSTSSIKADLPEGGKKWSGEYQFEVGGSHFSEGKDEGVAAIFFFKTAFEYHFNRWLYASVKPRIDFFSSRLQARFDNDDYRSGPRLTEAFIAAKPIAQIEARLGMIGQDYLNSPMLISKRRAFPGGELVIEQKFNFPNHQFKAEVVAQHTVPTSTSSNIERQDKEGLPLFDTQTVHISGKSFDALEYRAYGGHWQYSNLPAKVAYESRLGGNSVIGDDAAGSRFKTEFNGWYGGAEFCACVPTWSVVPVFEYQRIVNSKADAGFGNGEMWGAGPRFYFGDINLDVRYRRFFIEKDASVAFYMSSFLGNTNRMGDDVEFRLDFKAQKFAIIGEWANAVPIRDNALQHTMTAIFLGVETHYDRFF